MTHREFKQMTESARRFLREVQPGTCWPIKVSKECGVMRYAQPSRPANDVNFTIPAELSP